MPQKTLYERRQMLQTLTLGLTAAPLLASPQPASTRTGSGLFQPSEATELKLAGMRVRLGRPVQVVESHGYAYIPSLARFPAGELLLTYSSSPDTNLNPGYTGTFQISADGGRTWGQRYDVLPEHQPMIYVDQLDNSLLAIPAQLYPTKSGDRRNFQATYTRFEQGGRRLILEPRGVRVVDWPWPVESWSRPVPEANWYARMAFDGSALRLDGRLLATGYARKGDERLQRSILFASEDEGRTWTYFSTIADPSIMPNPDHRFAGGPSETALIRLADGDLMAVFRIGNGKMWNLHRNYSSDGGRTWSRPEPIPAYSVEPSLLRTQNGLLALSTGRPGLQFWLSADGRGRDWQLIDIVEHHNRWVADDTYRIFPYTFENPRGMNTWSYTELLEVEPNRLLLAYDRIPPNPQIVAYGADSRLSAIERLKWTPQIDSPERFRIFLLPIEVERPG